MYTIWAVFLALKEFQDLCLHKIMLIATDNTTVVSYINKGSMRLDLLCALMWRILTWCFKKQVTLKRDFQSLTPSRPAERGSRPAIQTECSLLPKVFQLICTSGTNLRPFCYEVQQTASLCVTSTTPRCQGSQCTQCLYWEDLELYAIATSSHFGQCVGEIQDCPCRKIILITPGWPNIPWFLGPSGYVKPNPSVAAHPALSAHPAFKIHSIQ